MLRRLRVIELHFEEELGAQEGVVGVAVGIRQQLGFGQSFLVELPAVDLCAELDNVAEVDCFFGISDEEGFSDKGGGVVEDLWLNQPVERRLSSVVLVRP